ncbi:MAG: DUF3426 domain-containing protein [Longimonas sp.]|uniref:FxLYD domain-containing protein n=1 Tax=Longimonas sp. TaxID=2039626 RepID=UPI0039767742
MRTRLSEIVVAVSLLLIGGLVMGCGNDAASRAEDINVRDFRYVEQPNGDREFTGEVENTGDSDVSIVQVEVSLFDETGNEVGTQQIEVEDVPANDNRPFTQSLTHNGPVGQARVSGVMVP